MSTFRSHWLISHFPIFGYVESIIYGFLPPAIFIVTLIVTLSGRPVILNVRNMQYYSGLVRQFKTRLLVFSIKIYVHRFYVSCDSVSLKNNLVSVCEKVFFYSIFIPFFFIPFLSKNETKLFFNELNWFQIQALNFE